MPRCFLAKQCNSKGYRPPDPDNRKWNSNEGMYVASTKVITLSPKIISMLDVQDVGIIPVIL